MPYSPVRTASRWKCQAFMVLAKPADARISSSVNPLAFSSALR